MSTFADLRAIAVDAAKHAGVKLVYARDWNNPGHRASGSFHPDTMFLVHHLAGFGDAAVEWCRGQTYEYRPVPAIQFIARWDGTLVLNYGEHCYHAGKGGPQTVAGRSVPKDMGNHYAVGVEIESLGTKQVISEDDHRGISPAQVRTVSHLAASWCRHYDRPVSAVQNHKDWAPTRKIDTLWPKAFWQQQVTNALAAYGSSTVDEPSTPATPASPVIPSEEDDVKVYTDGKGNFWISNMLVKRKVSSRDANIAISRLGLKGAEKIPAYFISNVPDVK